MPERNSAGTTYPVGLILVEGIVAGNVIVSRLFLVFVPVPLVGIELLVPLLLVSVKIVVPMPLIPLELLAIVVAVPGVLDRLIAVELMVLLLPLSLEGRELVGVSQQPIEQSSISILFQFQADVE